MNDTAKREAENFLNNEKQFHLGMLPTEQSNPKTRGLDKIFASGTAEGVKMLLSVDRDVEQMAQRVLKGNEFREMVESGTKALKEGKKIVLSGCGATGRLSILLESMWRRFFRDLRHSNKVVYEKIKRYEDSVFSIMTGGDYALIRSVEFFEDYPEFGCQQVREMNLTEGDVLIAITEGGETSSVLGTVAESADRKAKVFLLFNNPAEVLSRYIERSRIAIEDPRVTVLDLYCGPMAIAGSTRMQATTSEQLIAGAALETILHRLLGQLLTDDQMKAVGVKDVSYSDAFRSLLDDLLAGDNARIIGRYIELEKSIYQENGLVTYFADKFLLDIFTDTTERAPTFKLPPFKKFDDTVSSESWAFVKYPLAPTVESWEYILGRPVRCLEWKSELYSRMGAPDKIALAPPLLDKKQIEKFHIGNEKALARFTSKPNIAVNVVSSREMENPSYKNYINAYNGFAADFMDHVSLIVGNGPVDDAYQIGCAPARSALDLIEHLAVKLVLNTISTGTMVLMGRVTGNWMSWVEMSNKKLIDRTIRLISELCGLCYDQACYELYEALGELRKIDTVEKEKVSPVQYTINRINRILKK